jgi:hypothetical protein
MTTTSTNTGDPFRRLFDYIVSLHVHWETYRDLFGHSDDRIKRLNRRTGFVFRVLQDALLENIQLEIAKLFDRPEMSGHETLTLSGVLRDAPLPKNEPKRHQLEADLAALKLMCAPIITHRHRRLAHNDKAIAMDQEVLPGVSRRMIGDAIAGIAKLYSDISIALSDTEVKFDVMRLEHTVDDLMQVLDAGNEKLDADAKARREKFTRQTGMELDEDDDPPEV